MRRSAFTLCCQSCFPRRPPSLSCSSAISSRSSSCFGSLPVFPNQHPHYPSLFAQHRNQDPSQSRSLNPIRSRVTASTNCVNEVMGYFRVVRDERAQRLRSCSAARRSGARVSPQDVFGCFWRRTRVDVRLRIQFRTVEGEGHDCVRSEEGC